MLRSRILLMLLAMLPGAWLGAQVGPDPRENSFQFFVDGVVTQGVIGYRIEFNHDPQTRTDSRQLNTAYSPDKRRLAVTVTQKGLNRLQGWLNDATGQRQPGLEERRDRRPGQPECRPRALGADQRPAGRPSRPPARAPSRKSLRRSSSPTPR